MRNLIIFVAWLPLAAFCQTVNTGWISPTATGKYYNTWTSPANAYSSNNLYASRVAASGVGSRSSWEGFEFVAAGFDTVYSRVEGAEFAIEHYGNTSTGYTNFNIYLASVATLQVSLNCTVRNGVANEGYDTFGSSITVPSSSYRHPVNYGQRFYVAARPIWQSGASFYSYVDHVRIRVYYHTGWQHKINGVPVQKNYKINGMDIKYVNSVSSAIDIIDFIP